MTQSIFTVKKDIVEICKRVYAHGYVAANDGNISVRIDDDRVVMTPTGRSKGFLQPSDLVVVDMDGTQVAGTLRPSSEAKMHLTIYKTRDDIKSVVHAHPPTATGFAVAGIPLTQCVLPEVIIAIGSIPIAEYAQPGTQELGDVLVKYLKTYDAVLMENHGAITVGDSVENALFKMETMEHFAKIMFVAHQLGGPVQGLPKTDVDNLIASREKYGIRTDAPTCDITGACDNNCGSSSTNACNTHQSEISDDKIEQITRQVIQMMNK